MSFILHWILGCLGFKYATLPLNVSVWLRLFFLANAYVSGMEEDLDLYGNRLNYITVAWKMPSYFEALEFLMNTFEDEVCYVVFQSPSSLVLTKVP